MAKRKTYANVWSYEQFESSAGFASNEADIRLR